MRYGVEAKENLFLAFWGCFKTHQGYDRNPFFSGDTVMAPINGGGTLPIANRVPGQDDLPTAFSGGVKWEYQPRDHWKWSSQVRETHVSNGQYSIHLSPWPDSAPATPSVSPENPDSIFLNEEQMDQTIVQARLKVFGNGDDDWFVNAYHWCNRYDVTFANGIRMGYVISEIEAQRNLSLSRHRLSAGANIRRVQFEFAASRGITTPSYSQGGIEVRQAQIPPEWFMSTYVPGYPGNAPAAGHYAALVRKPKSRRSSSTPWRPGSADP